MTLFDIYKCEHCGFINNSKRSFNVLDRIKICPDCGHDKQEYIQGPTHDMKMGFIEKDGHDEFPLD